MKALRVLRKIFKILFISFLVLFVLLIMAVFFVRLNKEYMAEKLMSRVNPEISGELQVDALTLNPLVHFPRVAITLGNAKLFEEKNPDSLTQPIFSLEDFHVSVNVIDLIQSKIEITEVSLSNGRLDVVKMKDGKFNIARVFDPPKKKKVSQPVTKTVDSTKTATQETKKPTQPASDKIETGEQENQQELEIKIDEFEVDNLEILMFNEVSGLRQHLHFIHGEGDFSFADHIIEGDTEIELLLDKLNFSNDMDLENEDLQLSLDIKFNQNNGELNIHQSDLVFRNAHLFTTGNVMIVEGLPMDLAFEIADDELQFTRLFLTAEGVDNVKSGNLFLKGTARGSMNDSIPNIECYFGANDLTVEVPKSGDYIRNFKFNGLFESGTKADFSMARLNINDLSATLPTGYVKASSRIRNFKNPIVKYDLDAQFRMENLSRIFDLSPIQNLSGQVRIEDRYEGTVTEDIISEDVIDEHVTLTLDSLSFQIPEVIDIDLLDGSITGTIDSLTIDELRIRSEDSDLLVNGIISELSNFAFNTDTIVEVDVNIESDVFNFPKLFKALPKTARSFPYIIRQVDIDVTASTSLTELDQYRDVPNMNFDIRQVAASVDSLLDYVNLREGKFEMYEKEDGFHLDFHDFVLYSDGTTSDVAFSFIDRLAKKDSMWLKLNTEGLNPAQILEIGKDSTYSALNAFLSGNYTGHIILPEVDSLLLDRVSLAAQDFNYISKDTISAAYIDFISENIGYKGETPEEILSSFQSENDLRFGQLKTSFFQADSLGLLVNSKEGIISIAPTFYDNVGDAEEGVIYINFAEDPPQFSLDYTMNNLPLEEFLETFYSEELLNGNVDIKLNLDAIGLDLESITSSLSGSIYVVGDSLKLKGLNLDDVIKDFQRSQSFNLVDIGAVALAGPAGIVYSKGSSYVALLTVDKKDSTLISKFSSRWDLDAGRISAEDVAFATLKNRVAVQGWLDMKIDSLDMTIGVINEKGCAIFDQRVYGSGDNPEYSQIKFLKTLLAPVTNVIKGAVGVKCDVFYEGTVNHPEEPKKNKKKP